MPLTEDVDLEDLAKKTRYYSGADIEAVCREAAFSALRRDLKAEKITKADFEKALERIGPSITPDMESWYKSFIKQVRKVHKPTTPVT